MNRYLLPRIVLPLLAVLALEGVFRTDFWERFAAPGSHAGTSIRLKQAVAAEPRPIDFVTLGSSRAEYGLDHARIAALGARHGKVHANLSMPGSHWMSVMTVIQWLRERGLGSPARGRSEIEDRRSGMAGASPANLPSRIFHLESASSQLPAAVPARTPYPYRGSRRGRLARRPAFPPGGRMSRGSTKPRIRYINTDLELVSERDFRPLVEAFLEQGFCALFAGDSVRRERFALFRGRGASAAALSDCSDTSVGAP